MRDRQRLRCLLLLVGLAPLSALLAQTTPAQTMPAQEIKVLVLDGMDGKPQAGVDILFACEGETFGPTKVIKTDKDGLAVIPFTCGSKRYITVSAFPPEPKAQCGDNVESTLDEIMSKGVISNPSGESDITCPKKISKTLKPVPGQIVLFVRKPNWWQRGPGSIH
jgi:hypothetical protein